MDNIQFQIERLKHKILGFKYISVDEGWYQIIIDCDNELTQIDPGYKILQIKEKFGGLRYYIQSSDRATSETEEKMEAVIRKYEEIASRTCEVTGKPGVLMKATSGRYKTLSPEYDSSKEFHGQYSIVEKGARN